MHETVLASSILAILQDTVAEYEAKHEAKHEDSPLGASPSESQGKRLRIAVVALQVGILACVEPQTLRGCFEIMAEGTVAEKATLTIERQAMQGRCPDCGKEVETLELRFTCPLCQSEDVDWQGGQGMEISSIRVVEDRPDRDSQADQGS